MSVSDNGKNLLLKENNVIQRFLSKIEGMGGADEEALTHRVEMYAMFCSDSALAPSGDETCLQQAFQHSSVELELLIIALKTQINVQMKKKEKKKVFRLK